MADVIDKIKDHWFSLPYYKRQPLGEDLNKNINNLPGIKQWNEFQENALRIRQREYNENAEEGGAWNQFSNGLHDAANTLNNGLSTVISAPIKAAATLLHVDPNLLSKALMITGLGRGVKGVKGNPTRLRTINQNVLPTAPTSTPKALPKSINRTLNFKNRGGRLEWDGSGHATTEGLTLGIPQATSTGTRLSPVPTAPLAAANGNGNGNVQKKTNPSTKVSALHTKRKLLTEEQRRLNRRANGANRSKRAAPPTAEELEPMFIELGIPTKFISEYQRNARTGFRSVQAAASHNSKSGIIHHAGHHTPLKHHGDPLDTSVSKINTSPTTGRAAKIELASENLSKGDRSGNINQHVAELTGIPTTWGEDLALWWKYKNGEISLDYASDFTVEQMELLEAIPANWELPKVEVMVERIRNMPTPDAAQIKDIARDIKLDQLDQLQRAMELLDFPTD